MASEPVWAIMPFLDCPETTEKALEDLLHQSVPVRVLLIDNGSTTALGQGRAVSAAHAHGNVYRWRHSPPLPSLAATWNRALDFVWGAGGESALVVNNDVRLHPGTYDLLLTVVRKLCCADTHGAPAHPLFVTAVGVGAAQFQPDGPILYEGTLIDDHRGGPDFSCYLITKECHERYRFDENLIPAFCEDLDMHRRMMLSGDGKRIFSVNVPFLHVAGGSGTLKSMDPERRRKVEEKIAKGSRAYYRKKWGGPVNEETFWAPFGERVPEGVPEEITPTTPTLFRLYGDGGE